MEILWAGFQTTMIMQIQQESKSHEFSGFPMHIKVVYTLVYEVSNSIMSGKKKGKTLIKKYFIVKYLSYNMIMQCCHKLSICKKHSICKTDTMKHNKISCVYNA